MSVSKRKSDKLAAFKIGFGLSFTLQPFEVLRTRMVLQKEYGKRGVMGMFRLCKSILVKEGVLGFWRGSLLAVMKSTLSAGLFYTNIELISTMLKNHRPPENNVIANSSIDFMVGSTSKLITILVTNPLNVVKTRVEGSAMKKEIKGIEAARSIFSKSGFKGFYRGFSATLARDVPYSGIQFLFYRALYRLESLFVPEDMIGKNSLYIFFIGGASSMMSTLVTQPFDAVRVHQMNSDTKKSTIEIVKEMYKEGGLRNLYPGYIPRVARKSIIGALTWTMFEKVTENKIHK